jgi:hypothetical protein
MENESEILTQGIADKQCASELVMLIAGRGGIIRVGSFPEIKMLIEGIPLILPIAARFILPIHSRVNLRAALVAIARTSTRQAHVLHLCQDQVVVSPKEEVDFGSWSGSVDLLQNLVEKRQALPFDAVAPEIR